MFSCYPSTMFLSTRILGTASLLPGRMVTTAELSDVMPDRTAEELEARTGIKTRAFSGPDDTTASLGATVLRDALADAGLSASELRHIILVSSTGGDFLIPATVNRLMSELGIRNSCAGFDLNNACVGFLSALDVGSRMTATGVGLVAVVVVETLSKHTRREVPRPYVVLGDAAAAVVLGAGRPNEGVLGSAFGNNGDHFGSVFLGHPGLTGETESIRFDSSNKEISKIALEGLTRSAAAVLEPAGLTWSDVEWILPHQPNGSLLTKIINHFGIDPERTVRVVDEIGSVGAASIAVGLDRLRSDSTRQISAGDRILMVGVGAGLSFGALLYQVGADG
ncbi:MAG: 3-oxoacyl-[acyl-carrier-protein] synthase-3 [Myxococcota bacterium]|jgi:3-oxoacyl-[acyl-carrier-protein] synthase-3